MPRTELPVLLPLLLLAAACIGPIATPLETLPDLVDRRGGAAAGTAPLKVHPRGLHFELEASLVEDASTYGSSEPGDRAFHITLHADNLSGREVVLPFETWTLADDDGRRYRLRDALLWNPEDEDYGPAPRVLLPGSRSLLVAQFPAGQRVNLLHLIQVTLHWRYEHGGRSHRVATRFRVR